MPGAHGSASFPAMSVSVDLHPAPGSDSGRAVTYDDAAHFSGYADPDALPFAFRLPKMLADAVDELDEAVRPRQLAAASS